MSYTMSKFTREQIILALAAIPYIAGDETGDQILGRFAGVDFGGLDLSGLNLSRLDLRGAIFKKCNLVTADLSGSILADAAFDDADMRGTQLRNVMALSTSFRGADLTGAFFNGAYGEAVDFTDAIGVDAALANQHDLADIITGKTRPARGSVAG